MGGMERNIRVHGRKNGRTWPVSIGRLRQAIFATGRSAVSKEIVTFGWLFEDDGTCTCVCTTSANVVDTGLVGDLSYANATAGGAGIAPS